MHQDLFELIDNTIRRERLYANVNLMREDVMRLFHIGRHHLNDLLKDHVGVASFPQYINSIRIERAYELMVSRPDMTVASVAREVGLTPSNLREQFKRKYGVTPSSFKENPPAGLSGE